MGPGSVLILTLAFIILVFTILSFWMRRIKIRQSQSFGLDWKLFEKAIAENDIENINRYGVKLVWNAHLKPKHLKIISECVDSRINDFPEMEELNSAVINKKVNWKKQFPW